MKEGFVNLNTSGFTGASGIVIFLLVKSLGSALESKGRYLDRIHGN
jgi:hypothetical protein